MRQVFLFVRTSQDDVTLPTTTSSTTASSTTTAATTTTKWVSTRDPTWPAYNPHHGYEPYWPHGDWILQPAKWLTTFSRITRSKTTRSTKKPKKKTTTTVKTTTSSIKKYTVCEADCAGFLVNVGPVCARTRIIAKGYVPKGCKVRKTGYVPPFRSWAYCYGYQFDDYTDLFYTFDNYCEFLHSQCLTKAGTTHYVFLHTGKCLTPQGEVYKLPYDDIDQVDERWPKYSTLANLPLDRARHYLLEWGSELPRHEKADQVLAAMHLSTYGLLFTTNRTEEKRKLAQKRRRRTRKGMHG